tara:strand:+ start:176 stop:382 length:207 start_codon:yes stop_codon:yes gene_type:complete
MYFPPTLWEGSMRFDYKCKKDHIWEGWDTDKKCPKCGTKDFKKVFRTSPVIHMNPITDASLRKQGIIN